MKLSIIVPVYNMAADNKLGYCIESLVNQTIDDYEIIAVDDASTDNSYEILLEYQNKYPDRIKVFCLESNHRQGGAKNKGLDLCTGDYIGFVDSDDWILPNMYERLLKKAEEYEADIVGCDLAYAYEHTMDIGERIPSLNILDTGDMTHDKFSNLILNSGALVTKIYKRHIFFEPLLRFPEHMFYEDNAIGTEVFHRAKRIIYIEEPMYFYFQHGASTVHTVSEERCEDRMKAMRIMIHIAREQGYFDEYRDELEYKFFHLFYRNTLFSYLQGNQRKRIGFIKKLGKELRNTFPEFEKNKLVIAKCDEEEKKMISLQQKSTLLFVMYYKLLWAVRRIRHKL